MIARLCGMFHYVCLSVPMSRERSSCLLVLSLSRCRVHCLSLSSGSLVLPIVRLYFRFHRSYTSGGCGRRGVRPVCQGDLPFDATLCRPMLSACAFLLPRLESATPRGAGRRVAAPPTHQTHGARHTSATNRGDGFLLGSVVFVPCFSINP